MTASKKSTKKKDDSNALLVAMVDQTVQDAPQEVYTPVRLKCPREGQEKDYLMLSTGTSPHHLLELQCLEDTNASGKQFRSWMVGNRVVSNGKLYLMTRVDPLFWVLAASTPTTTGEATTSTQWQPLDQLLPTCSILEQILDRRQLQHLCDSYEMDDDDEVFYKFSRPKTLEWLAKKQQSVQGVLLAQLVAAQKREVLVAQEGGGAFAKGFCLTSANSEPEKEEASEENKGEPTEAMKVQAKQESLQIVCNYLAPHWQTSFLEHMKSDLTLLQEEQPNNASKKIRLDFCAATPDFAMAATRTVSPTEEEANNKPTAPKMSVQQKKLLKVNKKGMKSMTSFFAVKKKG